ncbi:MAG: pilus assembly PilX N-terminal domain-containing protein [Cognaticolwellia sp.]
MVVKNKALVMNNISTSFKQQQGVVLIVALVFLIALTGVAAALMQNTTSDMKMTGASNEKVIATQAAISAVDEVINNQLNIQAINVFTQGLNRFPTYTSAELLPAVTKTGATASTAVINNPLSEEFACPRSAVGSSVGIIECNILQLQTQRQYGRGNTSTIVVDATIAQQLLTNN